MKNVLFISGSPRKANTDFVLRSLYEMIDAEKEIVFLRDLDVGHCTGCLHCEKKGECPIDDDMQKLYEKMENADVIVFGTPNYFDNVSGLMKDLMDRSNTFYNNRKLEGKDAVFIVVGGGTCGDATRVTEQALTYFANGVGLHAHYKFAFEGTDKSKIEDEPGVGKMLNEISENMNELL